jgi:hypothetical protein
MTLNRNLNWILRQPIPVGRHIFFHPFTLYYDAIYEKLLQHMSMLICWLTIIIGQINMASLTSCYGTPRHFVNVQQGISSFNLSPSIAQSMVASQNMLNISSWSLILDALLKGSSYLRVQARYASFNAHNSAPTIAELRKIQQTRTFLHMLL